MWRFSRVFPTMEHLEVINEKPEHQRHSHQSGVTLGLQDSENYTKWCQDCNCVSTCVLLSLLWAVVYPAVSLFLHEYLPKDTESCQWGKPQPLTLWSLYVYSTKSQQQAPYNVRWRRYNDTRQCGASATLWAELCPQGEKSLLVGTKLLWLISYDETFPCW